MGDKTHQYLCADVRRVLGWQHRTRGPGQESQGESGESTHMRRWRKQRVPLGRVSGTLERVPHLWPRLHLGWRGVSPAREKT